MPTGPKPSPQHPRRLRLLGELSRGHILQISLAVLLSLVATAATLAVPLLVRELIDALARRESILRWLAVMVPLALTGALAASFSGYLLAKTGEQFILRLRGRVMEHTLRMPLKAVRAAGAGNLVARITSDAALLRSVIDVGVVQLPVAVVTALATLVFMALLDWMLVLLTLAVFAVAGSAIWLLLRRVRQGFEGIQTATGALAQRFTTVLSSLVTVKAHRAETSTSASLTRDAEHITDGMISAARLQSVVIPVMSLGQEVALACIVIAGGARISHGDLSLSDFIAFLLYLLQLVTPITIMVMGLGRLQTGLAAKARFEDLLSTPVEAAGEPGAARPDAGGDAVVFDRVSFGYDGEPVLREVSLRVPRRGLTAVVGHSGAGKSTLLTLIERFEDASSGSITVLGQDVRDWPLDALRSRIGYVDQSFTLLEGTVRENLLLGHRDSNTDDAALMSALAEVGMADVVRALPNSLDTVIGREVDVSGGQRQRIALARALLQSSDLVLLDEPTSQLDSLNEMRLRDVIDTLARDRSVLVVAHRLSTVMHADHVIVLKDGTVAETGTHSELMANSSHYRDLVEGQHWAQATAV
ncbi:MULTISPECIES: ABC transporter ATP-binding protein [Streptomyces]|uniref:ABC transporter ATP-binding protein n=1 Tax=Streptomyces TaxID=1883 RepID=UPI001E2B422A|nr:MULTISPECIES: ABC transporter ATP-binding protein [Streptomyces]UFQ16864.1 ABC transporter ATP-binding protein/permease [Streptomyces huasconensis]WCL86467.1 ABC transporter ATP-binding protein [Streptomyces sp. JCM 35825]